MRLLAPAKINLHLRVGPRRADGFHPLLSWMAAVGLFDNLVFEHKTAGPGEFSGSVGAGGGADVGDEATGGEAVGSTPAPIGLVCDMPGLPCDQRNLVLRIALAFREQLQSDGGDTRIIGRPGDRSHPASRACGAGHEGRMQISLHKRIPVGAGLGGGSSDAARTLMGLNHLWQAGWSADQLSAFAARFGSDLSFFVHGPSSICRGRGEMVVPIDRPTPRYATLVLPRLAMPTADVYRRFDQLNLGREEDVAIEPDWQVWCKLPSLALLPLLVNDLEKPAFDLAPQLGDLRRKAEEIAERPVRMSGSGSSLFTLFDSQETAQAASHQIERETGEKCVAVELAPVVKDDLG
jgi:4-diphosphocytidyl-2-C-methyl-D-erythritol kinase